jgi:hypothetical protein
MTPEAFKQRFAAGVLPDPPGLELGLAELVRVREAELEGVGVKAEDRELLTDVGLPRDAPPWFSFRRYLLSDDAGLPRNTFLLGANGSGDPICLELPAGSVVVFNHDHHMERIVLNSSLFRLAECLCVYQEHLHARKMEACLEAIFAVDPELRGENGYWEREIRHDQLRT